MPPASRRSPIHWRVTALKSAGERLALAAAGADYWLLRQRVLADCEDTFDDSGVAADNFQGAVVTRIPAWILPGEAP